MLLKLFYVNATILSNVSGFMKQDYLSVILNGLMITIHFIPLVFNYFCMIIFSEQGFYLFYACLISGWISRPYWRRRRNKWM